MTIADPINLLRLALAEAGSPTLSTAESEAWAKLERWRAASEGLPLMLGVSPTAWPGIWTRPGCAPLVDAVWAAFAAALGVACDTDPERSPLALRSAALGLGLSPPPAIDRLLDFIQRLLPAAAPTEAAAEAEVLAAQERETLLGAALMLVTRMPQDCVDELGYYDSARIAQLILQKALLWFPLGPPRLDRAGIETLLARWLPPKGSD